ncbi:MAG: hypothetical protein MJ229_04350 [bacterium]|nr:hypothetical protein [bacterium]
METKINNTMLNLNSNGIKSIYTKISKKKNTEKENEVSKTQIFTNESVCYVPAELWVKTFNANQKVANLNSLQYIKLAAAKIAY